MERVQLVIVVSNTFCDYTETGLSGTVQQILLKPEGSDVDLILDEDTKRRIDFDRYRLVYGAVLPEHAAERVRAELMARTQTEYRKKNTPSRLLGTDKKHNVRQLQRLLNYKLVKPVGTRIPEPLQEGEEFLKNCQYTAMTLDGKRVRFKGFNLHEVIKDII